MANLARKYQKIFGNNSINNGQFGSLQAGTKITTTDPEVIQALAAYENGWNDAVISGEELPSLEEFNGLQFKTDYQLSYILQKGIPEWDSQTEYFIGNIAKEVGGSKLYTSITDNNIGNALTDIANWKFLANASEIITTRGDIIRGSATGEAERLALGSAGQVLASDGTDALFTNNQATETQVGQAEIATQAEVNAGTDDSRIITAQKLLGLFTASSQSTNGYARIPINIGGAFDEIIIQWGTLAVGAAPTSLVLPLTYPNNHLSITAVAQSSFGAGSRMVGITSRTTAGATAYVYNGSGLVANDIDWISIGY